MMKFENKLLERRSFKLPLAVVGYSDRNLSVAQKLVLIEKFKLADHNALIEIFDRCQPGSPLLMNDILYLQKVWDDTELDDLDLAELFVSHLPILIQSQPNDILRSLDPNLEIHKPMYGNNYEQFIKTTALTTAARVGRVAIPRIRAKLAAREIVCLIKSDPLKIAKLNELTPRYLNCPSVAALIAKYRMGKLNDDPKISRLADTALAYLSRSIEGPPWKQARRYGYWRVDYFFMPLISITPWSEQPSQAFKKLMQFFNPIQKESEHEEREGFSIPAQQKYLRAFALEHNLKVVAEFCEAETAKKVGRRKFQEMILYLTQHPDVRDILVEKTDRLYRNLADYDKLDGKIPGLSIHLVKENETISDDSRSDAKFMEGLQVLMAKKYIDNLSEEVRKGQTEKASQGVWPSAAPFGYRNRLNDHTIEPDPLRARYVVHAFEMMAGRQGSLATIAQALTDAGARTTRKNAQLSKSHVQAILTREIYYGQFYWKNTLYYGKHVPLISKDLFDRAQIAMDRRQKPKLLKHESAYGGLLTCGHCGCAITADHKTKKSGRHYIYYRCTNGKRSCQSVVYLREEKLTEAFAEALKQIQLTPEREFHELAIKNLNQEIGMLQRRIERCYVDHVDGKISTEEWESRTALWKSERADLLSKLTAHDCADLKYMQEGVKLLELASRAHQLFTTAMTPAEKRETFSLVLSNPQIKDGTVCFDYRMPFNT